MTRRSIIVMLPEDLVARADARAAELTATGRPTSRDDLLAAALHGHLDAAARSVAPQVASPSPAAIDAVARRVPEELGHTRRAAGDALAHGRRKAAALLSDMRTAANASDRPTWNALALRLDTELAPTHRGVVEAFDRMAATARQSAQLLAGAIPALAPDARSRWMSAQAGRGLAPDRVLGAARALDEVQRRRTEIPVALATMTADLDHARASLLRHAEGAAPRPADAEVDADLDAQTWSMTAHETLRSLTAAVAAQTEVLEVGYEHGHRLAATHFEAILGIAREIEAALRAVPDVASACA